MCVVNAQDIVGGGVGVCLFFPVMGIAEVKWAAIAATFNRFVVYLSKLQNMQQMVI